MKYFKILNYFLLIILLISFSLPVFAKSFSDFFGPIVPCGYEGAPECKLCHLLVLGANIFKFLVTVSFAIASVFVAWGGFLFLTSGGSEERRAKAKNAIQNAVFGIVIILAGWLIINTILTTIVLPSIQAGGIKFDVNNWWKIECK